MKLIIRHAFDRAGFHIWLLHETPNGYRVAKPITIELGEENMNGAFLLPEPTMFLGHYEFKALKKSVEDELINSGLKKEGGYLDATIKHLEDMRALVFSKLGAEAPAQSENGGDN
jgi:hypothetical protein